MLIEIRNVHKSYNEKIILNDININIEQGELISLVGPSGVGKTTLLRILAGMEKQDSGEIIHHENLEGHNNPILVFQDYLLFPHLTTFENIAFGLKSRKERKETISMKVRSIASYLKIEDKLKFYPGQLSGGQKQRVAIARALVLNPKLLLLDEPFANLDKNLKAETANLIRNTQKQFNLSIVSVTHDLKEAFLISDKIGVLINSTVQQFDTPENIYRRPKNISVAHLLGDINIVSDTLLTRVTDWSQSEKGNKHYCIRPESIIMKKEVNGSGIIRDIIFSGQYSHAIVDYHGEKLTVLYYNNGFSVGDRVKLTIQEYHTFQEDADET